MNDSTLKEVLKVNFLSFTKEEIENIMEEELEKAPEEMDTELIDMCLDILMGEPEEKADEKLAASPAASEKKAKRIKLTKGYLAVAVLAVIFFISIPVSAGVLDIDVPDGILEFYDKVFHLDLAEGKQSKELDYLLAENNLNDVILPQFLFTQCEISEFESVNEELNTHTYFSFSDKKNNIFGRVRLDSLGTDMNFMNGEGLVNDRYEEIKQLTVNSINIIVFSENTSCIIIYYVNDVEYNIVLNGVSFDKAVEIANTL